MKSIILSTIQSNQAISGVQLVMKVMQVINPNKFSKEQYLKDLEELIYEYKIRRLILTPPSGPRSHVYILAGTQIDG